MNYLKIIMKKLFVKPDKPKEIKIRYNDMTIDQKRYYHRQRQQGILILCPVCQYSISSYKRKQHYKTKRHINNLKNYLI